MGLRAGIPMLFVPFAHDQPDNAARVTRLWCARTIDRKEYKAELVARELKELLLNPSYNGDRAVSVSIARWTTLGADVLRTDRGTQCSDVYHAATRAGDLRDLRA
jgi:UDP-glucoronosyl and UDP-glucosyl transferase